nr:AMP-binding protein [Streptomyces sp. TLI_235]
MKPYLWSPWASAEAHPDRPAVLVDDEVCGFAELVARADALATGLRARLPDGATVSTDLPAGPDLFALALAALRHGYGLFPVHPWLFDSPLAAGLLGDLAVELHVSDRPSTGLPCPVAPPGLLAAAGPGPAPEGPAPRAGHLAFTTSGTTGEPQAVRRARPPRPYKGVAVDDRYAAGPDRGPHLMANPTYHLGTLGPALHALQAGSAVVVQRDWSPGRFAELADRHGADSAFLSPDQLLDVVQARIAPGAGSPRSSTAATPARRRSSGRRSICWGPCCTSTTAPPRASSRRSPPRSGCATPVRWADPCPASGSRSGARAVRCPAASWARSGYGCARRTTAPSWAPVTRATSTRPATCR